MESYSVKAVLSGIDKGFTKTVERAEGSLASLASRVKNGVGFGAMMAIGQQAFSTLAAGASSMVGELESSQAAWGTFEGNMKMLGKSGKEIGSVKKELQDFAAASIYSASDMASTFSQLEAVGVKNTTKLVKGFGGLAAAAENPAQAMKTLSTQATQMAAKPYVAWQDYRLMMEQTPAGMAAVAKEMGMSMGDMQKQIQDGTLETNKFFDAISRVGTNKAFTKMATSYKNAGQALDGLKESLVNQLAPAWKVVDGLAQDALGAIGDAVGKVDVKGLASGIKNVAKGIKNVVETLAKLSGSMWSAFANTGAIESAKAAFDSLWQGITNVTSAIASSGVFEELSSILGTIVEKVSSVAKKFGDFLASLDPKLIKATAKAVTKLVMAFVVAKGINAFKNKLQSWTSSAKDAWSAAKKLASVFKKVKTPEVGNVAGPSVPEPGGASQATSKWQAVGNTIKSIFDGVGNVLKSFGTMIKTIFEGLVPVIKAVGEALATVAKGIGEGIAIALRGLGMALAMVPPTTWLAIAVAALAFGVALALVGSQGQGLQAILNGVATVITAFAPIVQTVVDGIVAVVQTLPAIFESIGSAIKSVFEGIGTFIESVGTTVATVVDSISSGISSIIDSIGGALKGILDGVANVIKSIGKAALNAGKGFKQFAAGVKTLTELNLFDMAATLGAIVLAMGGLSLAAPGIAAAGSGLLQMGQGLKMIASSGAKASTALTTLAPAVTTFSANLPSLATNLQSTSALMAVFGTGVLLAASGLASAAGSISSVASGLSSIANTAGAAATGIQTIAPALQTASAGFKSLSSASSQAVSKVKSTLNKLPSIASSAMSGVVSAFNSAATSAYQSGVWIGIGFANGMLSTLATVKAAANELAAQADKAIRAKAKIGSPSKVMAENGEWMGIGFANGMDDTLSLVRKTSANLFQVPDLQAPRLAFSGLNDSLNDDSLYGAYRLDVAIDAPVTLDGRKVGQMTAEYADEELKKRAKVRSRLQGVR